MAKVVKKKVGKPLTVWTEKNIVKLKKIYPNTPNEQVAEQMGLSVRAIRSAAVKFKVKKANSFWDQPEEKWLLENWPVLSAEELAEKLGRTKWAVINKYRELAGLRS